MKKRYTGLILLLAGSLLTACGNSGSKPADSAALTDAAKTGSQTADKGKTDSDPCRFLTREEVTAITSDVVTRTSRDAQSCTYHSDPDEGTEVTVYIGEGAKQMKIVRKTVEVMGGMGHAVADKGGAGADTEQILNSGGEATLAFADEALWAPNATLALRKGDIFIQVTPPVMHDPATHSGIPLIPSRERHEIAQKIAEQLMTRIETQ